VHLLCNKAVNGSSETEKVLTKLMDNRVYFRVKVSNGAKCQFSYSTDGVKFIEAGEQFQAEVGRWIGAKVGLFCTRTTQTNDSGSADYDWFRVEPLR